MTTATHKPSAVSFSAPGASYTPGPWTARQNHANQYQVAAGGLCLAFVQNLEPDSPRLHADAHLIAAAPELLEAVESAYYILHDPNMDDCGLDNALGILKRAAAKAKGGA